MSTTTALFVLNPRRIPYCMDALLALDVPTCWITNVTEQAAAALINDQIEATNFDSYVVISDDCEPTQDALDRVLAVMAEHPEACVTGYSNFDRELPFVNLCWNKLPRLPFKVESYKFMKRAQVDELTEPFMTTFAGLSFTGMSRDLWLMHPLAVSPLGGQMDYMLSLGLQDAGVRIWAAPGAFVLHHKDKYGVYPDASPEKQLLVGKRPPSVTWTNIGGGADGPVVDWRVLSDPEAEELGLSTDYDWHRAPTGSGPVFAAVARTEQADDIAGKIAADTQKAMAE